MRLGRRANVGQVGVPDLATKRDDNDLLARVECVLHTHGCTQLLRSIFVTHYSGEERAGLRPVRHSNVNENFPRAISGAPVILGTEGIVALKRQSMSITRQAPLL